MNTPDSNHPITPTDKLLYQWCAHNDQHATIEEFWEHIATQAAQWGADQRGAVSEAELQKARDEELEACKQVIIHQGWFASGHRVAELTAARRPQPSDKELALRIMAKYAGDWDGLRELDSDDIAILTRALEALPNG